VEKEVAKDAKEIAPAMNRRFDSIRAGSAPTRILSEKSAG
jgi:hypothetical protein